MVSLDFVGIWFFKLWLRCAFNSSILPCYTYSLLRSNVFYVLLSFPLDLSPAAFCITFIYIKNSKWNILMKKWKNESKKWMKTGWAYTFKCGNIAWYLFIASKPVLGKNEEIYKHVITHSNVKHILRIHGAANWSNIKAILTCLPDALLRLLLLIGFNRFDLIWLTNRFFCVNYGLSWLVKLKWTRAHYELFM